jgi:hypothetical protein
LIRIAIAGRFVAPCLALVLSAALALADGVEPEEFEDGLTGQDIYARVLANRFRAFSQNSRLISEDRAGRTQESRFNMLWRDMRNGDESGEDGVLSKALVRYTYPFDLRHAGYLILARESRSPDQFYYSPARRRIVRVSLRNEAVYGTDFSFEDVVPREAGEFLYRRTADREFEGVDVYVVELYPQEISNSEYSRIEVFVLKGRDVVVRSRYWDTAGVEVKELRVPPRKVREFDGVWVPTEAVMRHLLRESKTTLLVDDVTPNPEFSEDTFDLRKLDSDSH